MDNEKDLKDVPATVKDNLEIIPVKHVDQVLEHALIHQPTPLSEEEREAAEAVLAGKDQAEDVVTAHKA